MIKVSRQKNCFSPHVTYLRVPVQIRSRFEKTWLFLNMSLEKGSSLLIQEISRPITNDKKDHFGEWEGVSANPNFTNPLEKCENHSITKWGKCHSRKWKWPFPHSRFEHFRKTKTTYIDQIYPQLVGEMFSETNFLWCVSKNVKFHCGSFFKSGCTFQLHVKNATFLVKMLVISSNIC